MPKIEIYEKLFFSLLGKKYDYDTLEEKLTCGKAELDETPDTSLPENERTIKIDLNDTNRPDLWSTAGIARQLKIHDAGGSLAGELDKKYKGFLSTKEKTQDSGDRKFIVDPKLEKTRPFATAFVISGKPIDEPMLLDIIQTQEKLCWNYGRKRRSISMGVYRSAKIKWPVYYKAVNPDTTKFVPLTFEDELSCREILKEHPTGREYGFILENAKEFPILIDSKDEILSMPPIINSASLGEVKVGDSNLLVEMTGTDMPSLLVATNIVACDFADSGYEILPVKVEHPYETGFGKTITTPFYFQKPISTNISEINRILGSDLNADDIRDALLRMGNGVDVVGETITLTPPAYRNDFLHEVDIIEDVMMGKTVSYFKPEKPSDFTIGRLTDCTHYSRKTKSLMVGLGYQEMIFNYLGSGRDFIEKMNLKDTELGKNTIEISNPMSENFQFVRPSIIPSLLGAETISANAMYPHRIFEIGKVAYLCEKENTSTITRQHLGFLSASNDANFNEIASQVSSLLYYLDYTYKVEEASDPRFIPGRQAKIIVQDEVVGIFGEIHPEVLTNWSIGIPCVACEIDIEALM